MKLPCTPEGHEWLVANSRQAQLFPVYWSRAPQDLQPMGIKHLIVRESSKAVSLVWNRGRVGSLFAVVTGL